MAANHPKTTTAARAAAAALTLGAGLLLAGCAGGAEPVATADPHDWRTGQAPASSSAAPAPASGSVEDATPEEYAVAAGIVEAYTLGFTQSAKASAADLAALREPATDTLEGVVVIPSTCQNVLEGLNWSPAQLGEDAARTDFTPEKGNITGSIEVAKVPERSRLEAHYALVEELLGSCSNLRMNIQTENADGSTTSETVPLKSEAPAVAQGTADSALLWTRGTQGSRWQQQSLVLIKEKGGHVAMVSFIAASGVDAAEVATIATGVLNATLAALE
ncbi:hypothetical protein NCCP1664_08470 [Zafaria cholistanensis]|uniref:Uncharacterized protein n=1 Tax=Zafaria cholistanensis TaxID=1682741 RepID=A0A5A7NNH7_9MICC|nr:hypothetical protein [Zafaria cholistanensis]GER22350.1 hypothetical protein NCCP1664_08470 [Zafaria cholistanensis]